MKYLLFAFVLCLLNDALGVSIISKKVYDNSGTGGNMKSLDLLTGTEEDTILPSSSTGIEEASLRDMEGVNVVLTGISPTMKEGKIIKWDMLTGANVSKETVLGLVQSDKAVIEVRSPVDGIVHSTNVIEGSIVPVGEILCTIRPNK
eukprot:Filipodium_phascolosomae@DN8191_c0_g1_i1.p1